MYYLVTMALNMLGSENLVLKVDHLEAGKTGKHEYLSDFKGESVMVKEVRAKQQVLLGVLSM